ncbi:signal peptidase I [Macrococcus sp. EM39E]|uniref:signal peptidase I n=1 Tax=Macrococcus animalis TaxID=3395467 RepID=UPI0039BFEFC5
MKLKSFIVPFTCAVLFIVILRSFFISNYIIDGHSMEPNFNDGDRVLVNQFIDIVIEPKKNDVYFFKLNDNELMVKRIIATPGDYIKVSNKTVYINGKKTHYHDASMQQLLDNRMKQYRTVPNNCYLVLGDNIDNSLDSRTFGCINRNQMIGKIIFTYWHNKK